MIKKKYAIDDETAPIVKCMQTEKALLLLSDI